MEIIKKKIVLDNYTSRNKDTWGQMTATTFCVNVFFTQDGDDMGIFYDMPLYNNIVHYSILRNKLLALNLNFEFMNGGTFETNINSSLPNTRHPDKDLSDYFVDGYRVSGLTEDRLEIVKSYDADFSYKPGFNMNIEDYVDYHGFVINSVTRVISDTNNQNPIDYSIDVDVDDQFFGLPAQDTGLMLRTYKDKIRPIEVNGLTDFIPITEIYYRGQGFNQTNSLLAPMTKMEYLFGITSTPEVQSDVFIDRGRNSIVQNHLQFGEMTNINDLINYGNGYYNIIKI
tara:strand:+ start:64877 stop:65731 length:855 start_codon:yes stop_codon:yes gene_type:complete